MDIDFVDRVFGFERLEREITNNLMIRAARTRELAIMFDDLDEANPEDNDLINEYYTLLLTLKDNFPILRLLEDDIYDEFTEMYTNKLTAVQ